MAPFCADDLIQLFDQAFFADFNTRLVHAKSDPEYLPQSTTCDFHRIAFAHGFFASALHEVAHWCVAGEKRRTLIDFGYWYAPDGRSREQQQAFYKVEIKPQALEWIFSVAAGIPFRVSTDNLNGDIADDKAFEQDVLKQVCRYLDSGIPTRALTWAKTLADFYETEGAFLTMASYQLPECA